MTMRGLVIRSAAPVTQSHLSKTWRSDAPKATHLRKPVSCIAPAARHASSQILFQRPTPAIFPIATKSSRFARFWQGPESIAFATQATSELHFWCASRHNGVHFCDISTSNSGLRTGCFKRRNVLCTHFNKSSSKSAPTLRFFTILASTCVRTTGACNFWSFILPDDSAPAALASLLFDPPGATKYWENTVFRDFSTFSRTLIFFLLTLSLLWLFSPLFCVCP